MGPNQVLKYKAKIQSINDGFRRLSIWPLLEAGEFSAVTDGDLSHDELALSTGRLHDYISNKVDQLPESVQKLGRYAFMSKDTALFKGLQKAVEYGDFLGKAIQYDHWTQKKGLSPKEALGRISEEYVNFNRLQGRARGYLDSMGLMWFMNFKIRTAKIALSMIRENPVQALLGTFVPTHHTPMGNLGTPFSDNIFAKLFDDKLGYSLGPAMAFHAPFLTPVGQILSHTFGWSE